MRGAIPPLPNTCSWRGSQFRTGTTLPLLLLLTSTGGLYQKYSDRGLGLDLGAGTDQ